MGHFSREQGREHQSAAAGFSRLDLLAVLTMVAVLFLLATAAKATGNASSETLTCVQNQKQLIRAWQLYAEDNDGRLALNTGTSGANVTNWAGFVSFSTAESNWSPEYVLNPRYASLGPYVKEAHFFRCPSDLSKITIQGVPRPRIRSYSMNAALGRAENLFLPSSQFRLYTRLSDLVNPAPQFHFVFIEEHPDSMSMGDFYVNMNGINSPRNSTIIDYPAAFHNGSASVSFVDGHVEVKKWNDARTMPTVRYNGQLLLNVPSPDNFDVTWMAFRTSAVK